MACNSCFWLANILRCCGFTVKGEKIKDFECKQIEAEKFMVIDQIENDDFRIKVATPVKEEINPSLLTITSFSCPDIIERNQIGNTMVATSGEKRLICKKRTQGDQHQRPPRPSSDSNINAHLNTSPVTKFADPVGDGVYKNAPDCPTAGDVICKNVPDCQTAEVSKIILPETNQIESYSGKGKVEKAMEADGGDYDGLEKSSAQQHSKRVLPQQISELTKLTSSGFQSSDSQKNTVLVYQVLVDEMKANVAKEDENDVEMTDVTDQNSIDVDMVDVSEDGGAFLCDPTQRRVEITAGIQQEQGRGAEVKIFQQPHCINVIGSVTYITNQPGAPNTGKLEDKLPNLSEDGSDDSLLPTKIARNGSSNKFRLPTIIWNESVKVIYFNPRRKLRKTATSKNGQQDLIAVDVWPLKDASGCNLHARFSEVEARILKGDMHPTVLKGTMGDASTQKENSDEEDSSDGSKSSSESSSTNSD